MDQRAKGGWIGLNRGRTRDRNRGFKGIWRARVLKEGKREGSEAQGHEEEKQFLRLGWFSRVPRSMALSATYTRTPYFNTYKKNTLYTMTVFQNLDSGLWFGFDLS